MRGLISLPESEDNPPNTTKTLTAETYTSKLPNLLQPRLNKTSSSPKIDHTKQRNSLEVLGFRTLTVSQQKRTLGTKVGCNL